MITIAGLFKVSVFLMLEHIASARLPTEFGVFTLHLFIDEELEIAVLSQLKHVKTLPFVRLHSSCMTGDIFHSLRCDCGEQLKMAMQKIQIEGGIVIYLPQEGRGIGLANKIKAYALQDQENLDTVDANLKLGLPIDARDYQKASAILEFFAIKDCVLLTNNPLKVKALESRGFKVQRESLQVAANLENKDYLNVKIKKMGHLL